LDGCLRLDLPPNHLLLLGRGLHSDFARVAVNHEHGAGGYR